MSLPYLQPYLGLSNGLNTLHAAGGPGGAVGGWVELGRTTLGGANSTIDVTSLSDKRYYMILTNILGTNSPSDFYRRYNSDSGSNYASRRQVDGGADATNTSQNAHYVGWTPSTNTPHFMVSYVANYATKEKLQITQDVHQSTAGAGYAPDRTEFATKWANTSNAISSVTTKTGSTQTMNTGSEVVVLGYDPLDSHTNNFWEELYSDSQTGQTVDNIDSGTFTNKKYLWVQLWVKGTANTTVKGTFNNSSDSTYAFRYSNNGAADTTGTSRVNFVTHNTKANATKFINMFIVNDGTNEILGIGHTVEDGGSGAANDPDRREFVFKRSTATAITDIEFDNDDTGDFTDWEFKIWGAD